MATSHDNKFYFEYTAGMSVTFEYVNKSENYTVTDGQPFGPVEVTTNSSKHECLINIHAGRKGDSDCADWYGEFVDDNENHMIHTQGGDHNPSKLNFAIKGTLTIDGNDYKVCLGQGSKGGSNNWHLASNSISSDSNGKNGDIENKYQLKQDGSHSFKISIR